MAWRSLNDLLACLVSVLARLKESIGRICFYPTARYFQVIHLHYSKK